MHSVRITQYLRKIVYRALWSAGANSLVRWALTYRHFRFLSIFCFFDVWRQLISSVRQRLTPSKECKSRAIRLQCARARACVSLFGWWTFHFLFRMKYDYLMVHSVAELSSEKNPQLNAHADLSLCLRFRRGSIKAKLWKCEKSPVSSETKRNEEVPNYRRLAWGINCRYWPQVDFITIFSEHTNAKWAHPSASTCYIITDDTNNECSLWQQAMTAMWMSLLF